jgi:pimeloyl-ACP methyl ester carboxylesterase
VYRLNEPPEVDQDWAEPDERTTLHSRGLTLEVCRWGDAEEADLTLLCTHGYLDCADVFAPLAAELTSRSTDVALVSVSLAGHGRSDWADSYGWYDHTVDVLAFLDHYRTRRRTGGLTAAVGHSFGAVQTLEALCLSSEHIDFAVNFDAVSGPFALPSEELGSALAKASATGVRHLPSYPRLQDLVERRRQFNPRLNQETLRRFVPHLATSDSTGWRWRVDPALVGWVRPWDLSGAPPTDPLALTGRLSIDVLTVTGAATDDPRIRGTYPGDEAIAAMTNVHHVALPDAGHYVHLESVKSVAAAVLEYAGSRNCQAP